LSVVVVGVLGAWGFIASTLLHRAQRNPSPHHACTLLTWALTRNEKRPLCGGRFRLYIWDSGGRIRTCDLRVMSSLELLDQAGLWLVQAVPVGPSWT